MISFPNAKINLGLRVNGKRDDNYHDIETVLFPISLCDVLEIVPSGNGSSRCSLHLSGISIDKKKQNSCVAAYEIMSKDFKLPEVKIFLHKIIPTGAGLGGGSADAAFAVKMLNEIFIKEPFTKDNENNFHAKAQRTQRFFSANFAPLRDIFSDEKFDLKLSENEMAGYAASVGSDCPFFLYNKPCIATGRGEVLKPVDVNLNEYYIVVVYPEIPIDTQLAYKMVDESPLLHSRKNIPLDQIISRPIQQWKNLLHNDFEPAIFQKWQIIKKIKDTLYHCGAIYASLSGSGSAVFGIFRTKPDVKKIFPGYKTWSFP